MKIKRLLRAGAATVLSLSSLLTLAPSMVNAAATTLYWCAQAGSFSTVTNWNTNADCTSGTQQAPAGGEDLIFDDSNLTSGVTLNNDISSLSVNSITFSGTNSNIIDTYQISGNALTVTNGITVTARGGQISVDVTFTGDQTLATNANNLTLDHVISGTGNLTKTGSGILFLDGTNTFTGNLAINAGAVWISDAAGLGTSAGGTTISDGAQLLVDESTMGTTQTIAEPLNISGKGDPTSDYTDFALGAMKCLSSGCTENVNLTWSGNVTLGADTTVMPGHQMIFTGPLSGAHSLSVGQGQTGQLVLQSSANSSSTPNGTYEAPKVTITLSDAQPTFPESINNNETVIIDGTRQYAAVNMGGILKGTGTIVGQTDVAVGGTIAPGHSPGCLNVGDFSLEGTYQAEIGGTDPCTGYDQIKVTGTVGLSGTLQATLYNGFVPKVGQSYTVIDNDGSDAVTGTFQGIAEGGSYTNQGVTYTVTYKGGDGNDVVLTVTSIDASKLPAAPDTGMKLVAAHPALSLGITTVAALFIVFMGRRMRPAPVRARARR